MKSDWRFAPAPPNPNPTSLEYQYQHLCSAHSTGTNFLSVSLIFSGCFSQTMMTLVLSIQSSWPGASS